MSDTTEPTGSTAQADRDTEPWVDRFTAARLSLPEWSRDRPERCLYLSNQSGVFELYAWDRAENTHRQITDRPNGTADGALDPSGEFVWWFDDTDGDEFGRWRREPFDPGPGGGPAEVAVQGLPAAYSAGLAIGRTITAVGSSGTDGSTIVLVDAEGTVTELYRHAEDAGVGGLSEDETLLVVEHSEHGDTLHPDLRVFTTNDGSVVAELADGPDHGLSVIDFSPLRGDQRVLISHERRGRTELAVWDVSTGEVTELPAPPDGGEVADADWYPDARTVLVVSERAARGTLYRYGLHSGEWERLDAPGGVIAAAAVRPDGSVEYAWSDSATPPTLRVTGRTTPLLVPPGPAAPRATPVADEWVDGPGGAIHTLIATPPGHRVDVPAATIFLLHGGPHWLDSDSFSAARAAYVDAGYVVVHVNYRGSIGYGSAWRDSIIGRPGLTELEDVAAVHDWAVASGLADPARCVLAGASWGGYLCLLGLGRQPERWAAGVAGVPVADFVASFEDEMEQLQAVDRVLFGGGPEEVPQRYARSSPISYCEYVRAPLLLLYGRNDPRCPQRQIERYLARLTELRLSWEEYRYDAGHGSLVVDERIAQMRAELDFVRRQVPA